MSEERFFNSVRESLVNYSPEAPQHVYQSMRKRLWWSNFVKLDMSRLNLWYLLLGLGVATSAVFYSMDENKEQVASTQIEAAAHPDASAAEGHALSSAKPQNSCQSSVEQQTGSATVCNVATHPVCAQVSSGQVSTNHSVASPLSGAASNLETANTTAGSGLSALTSNDGDAEVYTDSELSTSGAQQTATQAPVEQVAPKPSKPADRPLSLPVFRDKRK
jgi:hypothetical protein